MSEPDGSGVKSAGRALTILELFSRCGRALSFTEVVDRLGYPRSSLHGLLHTLTDRGWLRLDPATRRFSLGLRAWETGNAYRPATELTRAAAAVLAELREVLEGSVHLAVLDGRETVRLLGSEDGEAVRAAAHTTAAGRVLLADLDLAQRARHLAETPGAPATVEELHRRLDRARSEGWAEDDGPDRPCSVAVPVRDGRGAVVAALGVTARTRGLPPGHRDETLRALRQGAEQISAALGLHPVG